MRVCGFCRHEIPYCTCAEDYAIAVELYNREQEYYAANARAWADYDELHLSDRSDADADREMELLRARAEERTQMMVDFQRGD